MRISSKFYENFSQILWEFLPNFMRISSKFDENFFQNFLNFLSKFLWFAPWKVPVPEGENFRLSVEISRFLIIFFKNRNFSSKVSNSSLPKNYENSGERGIVEKSCIIRHLKILKWKFPEFPRSRFELPHFFWNSR